MHSNKKRHRGQLHMMAARLKGQYSVETVAVCDLRKNNRERAASSACVRNGP